MKRFVNNIISLNLDEISSYDFPLNEYFGLEIVENEIKYEFLIKISSVNKNLICNGSGGVYRTGPEAIEPPIFNRHSWYNEFEESFLVYNDPCYYHDDDVRIGWYVGTPKIYYLEIIARIITKIVESVGIKNENILFFGSSGGGFSAIQLGTLIKKSTVLVNNPQTIVKNYHRDHVENMLNRCFKGLNEEFIFDEYGYRLNVIEMFKKENYVPNILYFVNSKSIADVKSHLIPLIEGISELSFHHKDLEIVLYSDDRGHSPMADSMQSISLIAEKKLYNYKNHTLPSKKLKNLEKENKILKYELEKYKSRKIVKFANKLLKIKNLIKK